MIESFINRITSAHLKSMQISKSINENQDFKSLSTRRLKKTFVWKGITANNFFAESYLAYKKT